MREDSYMLFSGSSHPRLAEEIGKNLGIKLGSVRIESFPDGEIGVQVLENVRGKDIFLVQSIARNPNHYLMELLILVDALRRASARSIIAVMPYYPYSRQDRKEKGRVPITARLVANLLERAGVARVLTMDLHTEQIQGFFDIPVDNLYARPLLVEALKRDGIKKGVIVSPDIGSNRMARKYAEDLQFDIAIVDKRRIDARCVEGGALIGDVAGCDVVLVDDICSTGGTLELAAKVCRERGAKRIFAAVTHGLMARAKIPVGIDRFYVTDTIPISGEMKGFSGNCVSVAPLLAEAIDCIVKAKSISSIFD